MVFSSLNFLFLFLPDLLACYFILPGRWRWGRNLVLLGFSLFFYGCAGMRFLPLMTASILMNYLFGLLAPSGRWGRLAVIGSAACNLALLGWFKYAVFAAGVLNSLGMPRSSGGASYRHFLFSPFRG